MPYISQTIPFHSWDYSFGVYPMTPPMSGATCQPLRQLKLRRSWSQYPAARPGEPPTKGLQGGVWQKCGKWWENDGSLWIIYDCLWLFMSIYAYLWLGGGNWCWLCDVPSWLCYIMTDNDVKKLFLKLL